MNQIGKNTNRGEQNMYTSSVPVEENEETVRDESSDSGGKFAVAW
ncbi:hypothetical protein Plim_3353 [Planctopirus limnophila DSM 3776]|uniref:Uncharacterized protein n=1 Tax=Planctopirus limnophila (strain ATCC 43296 / DSM 3776 / IFAM 1008 / Mu 290) TaxID=521674 RepID=D5SUB3_PLAL2|nr:hypothetical protein Plim_3353 [Planctopirus limnophila DSM 3776]